MMKIEDMADLIAMYNTQASVDKIICLATGEDTISALEYVGSGLDESGTDSGGQGGYSVCEETEPMEKELPEVIVEKCVVVW